MKNKNGVFSTKMGDFTCQLDWALGYPRIWFKQCVSGCFWMTLALELVAE